MDFRVEKRPQVNIEKYGREEFDIAYKFAKLAYKEFGSFTKAIVLFGSVAKGTYHEKSDIDIFICKAYKRIDLRKYENKLGHKINLLFGIDTSGSMSAENLAEALTELNAIVNDFENWKITFVTCEMDVELVGEYSSEIGDDFTTFSQDFKQGGGTDMNPIITFAESMEEEPDAMVIITDGYLSADLLMTHIPVIVVIVRGGIDELNTHHHVIRIDD